MATKEKIRIMPVIQVQPDELTNGDKIDLGPGKKHDHPKAPKAEKKPGHWVTGCSGSRYWVED